MKIQSNFVNLNQSLICPQHSKRRRRRIGSWKLKNKVANFEEKVQTGFSSIDQLNPFQNQQSLRGRVLKLSQSSSRPKTSRIVPLQYHGLHIFLKLEFIDLPIISLFWSHIHACYHICIVSGWFNLSSNAGMARRHC